MWVMRYGGFVRLRSGLTVAGIATASGVFFACAAVLDMPEFSFGERDASGEAGTSACDASVLWLFMSSSPWSPGQGAGANDMCIQSAAGPPALRPHCADDKFVALLFYADGGCSVALPDGASWTGPDGGATFTKDELLGGAHTCNTVSGLSCSCPYWQGSDVGDCSNWKNGSAILAALTVNCDVSNTSAPRSCADNGVHLLCVEVPP
jgi:hypothetical protein